MEPENLHIATARGTFAALRWNGPPGAPWLLFAHATGMCAAIYQALLAPLADRYRILAYDARGHGGSTVPVDPADVPVDWLPMQHDLAAIANTLDGTLDGTLNGASVVLAGHSLGGSVAIAAAARWPALARAVVAIDPAFIPFDLAPVVAAARATGQQVPNPMAEQAIRRRADWPDRATIRAAYHGRGVFAGWADAALDAYICHGVRDMPRGMAAGGVTLACSPAWEAAVFAGVSTTMAASIAALKTPLVLLHADTRSTVTQADADTIAVLLPSATVHCCAGTGHFLPVTHPDTVRPWIAALA
jgi:pimeloyl-ACP methyl ester carboxylesterase